MEKNIRIGDRLREYRETLGESQKDLPKKLGINQQALSKYEKGMLNVPDQVKVSLLQYGVSAAWLLTGEGPMFSSPPTIGGRLKAARQNAGLDQEGFALMLSCSLNDYQGFESDETEPTDGLLRRLEGNFNASPVWIRTGQGEMDTTKVNRQAYAELLAEDDGFRRAVPDVYSLYNENQRLKEQIEAATGCAVCSTMAMLQQPSRAKVSGYAEALLQIHRSNDQPKVAALRQFQSLQQKHKEVGAPVLAYATPEEVQLPLVLGAAAGEPRETVFLDDVYTVGTDRLEGQAKDYAAVKISGASMINAGIDDGDIVTIRKDKKPKEGRIYLFRHQGEFTLKRYEVDADGTERLAYDDGSGRSVVISPGEWEVIGAFCFVGEE